MTISVCSGSRYKDKEAIFTCLDELHTTTKVMFILNGGACGADYFASTWARERGVRLKVYKTDRKRSGENTFFELNGVMLETG